MSFLTPLGWALTATGIFAPAGIPLILADKTNTGETLGNLGETLANSAVSGSVNVGKNVVLSDAQIAEFRKLDVLVRQSQPKTSKSQNLKDKWIQWHTDLSFWEQNFDTEKFNEARNRWIDFVAEDSADPEQTRNTLKMVPSLEQSLGLPDPRKSDGYYPLKSKPLIPDIPLSFKIGAGLTAVLGVILAVKLK